MLIPSFSVPYFKTIILLDLQRILPSGMMTGAFLDGVHRTYNTLHGRIFSTASGQNKVLSRSCMLSTITPLECSFLPCVQVLVTRQGEIDPSRYIDPVEQKIVDVDHAKGVSFFLLMLSWRKYLSNNPLTRLSLPQKGFFYYSQYMKYSFIIYFFPFMNGILSLKRTDYSQLVFRHR